MNVRCPGCETVYRVDPAKVPAGGVRARCAVCSDVFAVSEAAAPQPALSDSAPRQTPRARWASAAPAEPVAAAPQPRLSRPVVSRWSVKPPAPVAPPPSPAKRPSAPVFRPAEGKEVEVPPVPEPTPEPPPAPEPAQPMAGPTIETPVRPIPRLPKTVEIEAPPTPVEEAPEIAPPVEPPATTPTVETSAVAPPPAPPAPPTGPAVVSPPAIPEPAVPAAPEETKKPVNPFLARDPRQKARRLARALVSDMIVYQPEKRQQALAAGNLKEAFAEEVKKSWEEFVGQVGHEMAESSTFFHDALNEILADGQQIF